MSDPAAPAHRYAVYYAPAHGSPWWDFGAHWLGRDEVHDVTVPHPDLPGLPRPELAWLTAPARRYGFHATLKAPFRLAQGASEEVLIQHLHDLAAHLRPVRLGALVPTRMSGFVALMPPQDPPGLEALARQCVQALDPLRAPPDEAERDKRRAEMLDTRAQELFERYGYPHVLERFRFHMTLSTLLDEDTAARVLQVARAATLPLNRRHAPVLDRLCLFVEPEPGAPFLRRRDFVLGH